VAVHSSHGGIPVARGWTGCAGVDPSRGGGLVAQGCSPRAGVMWPSWLLFVRWWHLLRQGGREGGGTGGAHLCVIV
jgi:hypothetical protein